MSAEKTRLTNLTRRENSNALALGPTIPAFTVRSPDGVLEELKGIGRLKGIEHRESCGLFA
jgi:hypothetical protein